MTDHRQRRQHGRREQFARLVHVGAQHVAQHRRVEVHAVVLHVERREGAHHDQQGGQRGAGRPEATALLERIVDQAALTLGIDPIAGALAKLQLNARKYPADLALCLDPAWPAFAR